MRAAAGRQGTESRPCRTSAYQAASAQHGCSREDSSVIPHLVEALRKVRIRGRQHSP
jgi:hypothetical protein